MSEPTRTCSSLKGGILGYTVVMREDLSQSLLVLAAVVARGGWLPAQLGLARSAYTTY